eukprot:TRINITY_DN15211_c0_g1_i2.p4 TRINITY_DN15211_c0_g1~~TRINITY_DN15211_c0_g1_i2.p4  ORF type:complete len:121 (+),score=15.42 TRINITY_DN15211_c0_g1_i2:97-459(+)
MVAAEGAGGQYTIKGGLRPDSAGIDDDAENEAENVQQGTSPRAVDNCEEAPWKNEARGSTASAEVMMGGWSDVQTWGRPRGGSRSNSPEKSRPSQGQPNAREGGKARGKHGRTTQLIFDN